MQSLPERIASNLALVRKRIGEAAARTSRNPSAVALVAVTKGAGSEEIRALLALGVKELGENRLQPALPKMGLLAADVSASGARWRMIGHLQTNKAKQALQNFTAIDALDSIRLLESLAKEACKLGLKAVPCLAEVNVSGEAQKYGLKPTELQAFLGRAKEYPELVIHGLMTMAPYADAPDQVERVSRPVFQGLRALRESANAGHWYTRPLTELSMGMSNDFEIAIEEGATLVRVGSALFEK